MAGAQHSWQAAIKMQPLMDSVWLSLVAAVVMLADNMEL